MAILLCEKSSFSGRVFIPQTIRQGNWLQLSQMHLFQGLSIKKVHFLSFFMLASLLCLSCPRSIGKWKHLYQIACLKTSICLSAKSLSIFIFCVIEELYLSWIDYLCKLQLWAVTLKAGLCWTYWKKDIHHSLEMWGCSFYLVNKQPYKETDICYPPF